MHKGKLTNINPKELQLSLNSNGLSLKTLHYWGIS